MQTAHVVMILACNQHAETTGRILDEAQVDNWVVVSGEQARRVGHLQYTPLWPSTSSRVIFAFAEQTVIEQMLQALTQAVHNGTVCPTCLAFTWEAKQPLTPSPMRDPVCGMVADRDRSPKQTHGGTTHYFCSTDCRDRFVKDPDMYVQRAIGGKRG